MRAVLGGQAGGIDRVVRENAHEQHPQGPTDAMTGPDPERVVKPLPIGRPLHGQVAHGPGGGADDHYAPALLSRRRGAWFGDPPEGYQGCSWSLRGGLAPAEPR